MSDDTAEPPDRVASRLREVIAELRAELDAARIEISVLRAERRTLMAMAEQARDGMDVALMRIRREP